MSTDTAVDTYRRHATERQQYIDRCAVSHIDLEAMDKRAVEEIIKAHMSDVYKAVTENPFDDDGSLLTVDRGELVIDNQDDDYAPGESITKTHLADKSDSYKRGWSDAVGVSDHFYPPNGIECSADWIEGYYEYLRQRWSQSKPLNSISTVQGSNDSED